MLSFHPWLKSGAEVGAGTEMGKEYLIGAQCSPPPKSRHMLSVRFPVVEKEFGVCLPSPGFNAEAGACSSSSMEEVESSLHAS